MKKLACAIVVTAAALTLAGCASSGNQSLKNETEYTVSAKITEGVTTQAEVREMFGSPMETSFTDGGSEIWEYSLADMKSDVVNFIPVVNLFGSSASGTKKDLTVLFDENDVVHRYAMSSSDVSTKTGLFK
ncbi:SmpA / OmlA family protein [Modicisalibacter ilicicola DSM 19980]|uniref:SmpA / OmlA family protein n=1 Tax=Modicisalibacter ilicicola DSM 19980 TaxID=1121942 RepID=A0A1M4W1H2_9GAMM|nr:outer membrane protein assembly factor BamE [Halomonas ilicicola]SHE75015.1 SmpA / OmlA family protein [Halomonas ilicicola DSM 19980]